MCKNEIGLKTTLNDHLEPVEVVLDLAHQIIDALSSCDSISKAYLQIGFSQVLVAEESWDNLVIKLKILCPELGGIIERWLVDPTAVQGLKPSPGVFNKIVRFFILLLIAYFPKLYTSTGIEEFEREVAARWGVDWEPKAVAEVLVAEMNPSTLQPSKFEIWWAVRTLF